MNKSVGVPGVPIEAVALQLMAEIVRGKLTHGDSVDPDEVARLSFDLVHAHIREAKRERIEIAQIPLKK